MEKLRIENISSMYLDDMKSRSIDTRLTVMTRAIRHMRSEVLSFYGARDTKNCAFKFSMLCDEMISTLGSVTEGSIDDESVEEVTGEEIPDIVPMSMEEINEKEKNIAEREEEAIKKVDDGWYMGDIKEILEQSKHEEE